MAKRARIVLTSYQKQRILSLFEDAVKYNSTHMHVYRQSSEMLHIYMNTAEFSCLCTLDALFRNRPERHS